jgi:hypothetical protein
VDTKAMVDMKFQTLIMQREIYTLKAVLLQIAHNNIMVLARRGSMKLANGDGTLSPSVIFQLAGNII